MYQFAIEDTLNQRHSIRIMRIVPGLFWREIERQQIEWGISIGIGTEFECIGRWRVLHQEASNAEMTVLESVMETVPMVLGVVKLQIDRFGGEEEAEDLDLIEFTTNHCTALPHFVAQIEI